MKNINTFDLIQIINFKILIACIAILIFLEKQSRYPINDAEIEK
jgi:hypothetical protein